MRRECARSSLCSGLGFQLTCNIYLFLFSYSVISSVITQKMFIFVFLSSKDGCNYLHAAIKSGEVECVEVLLQHILASDDGLHLLHWLAGGPDHHGNTPLALAVAGPTADLLAALGHAGLDIPALLSHDPSLLKLASPACLALLSSSSKLQEWRMDPILLSDLSSPSALFFSSYIVSLMMLPGSFFPISFSSK